MTTQMTPVELEHRRDQIEIQEKPEDTPRSVDVIRSRQTSTGRTYANTLLVLATATQILGSSEAGITDYLLTSKDMTTLSNEAPVGRRRDFFIPYPISTLELDQEGEAEVANRIRLELLARLYVSKKLSAEEDVVAIVRKCAGSFPESPLRTLKRWGKSLWIPKRFEQGMRSDVRAAWNLNPFTYQKSQTLSDVLAPRLRFIQTL